MTAALRRSLAGVDRRAMGTLSAGHLLTDVAQGWVPALAATPPVAAAAPVAATPPVAA